MSETYEEFKAYSQNMGHETTEITERYYSKFAREDVKRIVTNRGREVDERIHDLDQETLREFQEFLDFKKWLNRKKE
jgi:hypothetical protein